MYNVLLYCVSSEIWLSARDGSVPGAPALSTNVIRRQYKTLDGTEYIPFSAWKQDQPTQGNYYYHCVVLKESKWKVKYCAHTALVVCFALSGKTYYALLQ